MPPVGHHGLVPASYDRTSLSQTSWGKSLLIPEGLLWLAFPSGQQEGVVARLSLLTALCPPEGSKEPTIYTVVSPPSCKHDLLLFLIIDAEYRVAP